MAVIIGTDEAGYGPNFGPLVVAASAWHVPDGAGLCDLYEVLGDGVCRTAGDAAGRLAIADSKQLYKPGGTLAHLEQAVFVALLSRRVRPTTWRELWPALVGDAEEALDAAAWHADYDEPVPLACSQENVAAAQKRLFALCGKTSVRLLGVRSAAILPAEFNRRVRQLGSKGALLTESTLRLAAEVVAQHPAEQVYVLCDKHGGRSRYAAPLQHVWPESWVQVLREGQRESAYRLAAGPAEVEIRFCVRAESHLPAALASMTAKYLRELDMRAFNAFWQRHADGLRPTAGYPTDARRFKQQIAAAQERLKIPDDALWRCR